MVWIGVCIGALRLRQLPQPSDPVCGFCRKNLKQLFTEPQGADFSVGVGRGLCYRLLAKREHDAQLAQGVCAGAELACKPCDGLALFDSMYPFAETEQGLVAEGQYMRVEITPGQQIGIAELLERPRRFAEFIQADHARTALQRMECPAHGPDVLGWYAAVAACCRTRDRLFRLRQHLMDLADKNRHDFDIGVICRCGHWVWIRRCSGFYGTGDGFGRGPYRQHAR